MGLRELFRMSKVFYILIGGGYRIVHNFQNSSDCILKAVEFYCT